MTTIMKEALSKISIQLQSKDDGDSKMKNSEKNQEQDKKKQETNEDNVSNEQEDINKKLEKMKFITKEDSDKLVERYFTSPIQYYLADSETNDLKYDLKYFDEYPRALAYRFVSNGDSLTQIRSFYYKVEQYGRGLKIGISFKECEKELRFLVDLSCGRMMDGKLSNDFYDFLRVNKDFISNINDFFVFKRHFESILCYIPKDNGGK